MSSKSKLWDIVKKVGAGIIRDAIPGADAVISAVNAVLPADKQLPADATGHQVQDAVNSLPPEVAAQVMMKEFDVQIEGIRSWTDIQKTLNEADQSGASTRPWIAKLMASAVFIAIIVVVAFWASSVVRNDVDTLAEIKDSWEFITAVLATPTVLLRSYFGMRTEEKKARYSAASGMPMGGLIDKVGAMLGRK